MLILKFILLIILVVLLVSEILLPVLENRKLFPSVRAAVRARRERVINKNQKEYERDIS